MTENNKLNIKAAAEYSRVMEPRVRFLVACAEAEPMGSDKRNEFNMCIEELLWWAKTAHCLVAENRKPQT